ncbi:hypothetical protein HYS47_04800 [Candidatus Woesearchaeota archaeon]|nr:hypothetical protein [Candidatus Woesearchaeota archaeon]
MRDKKRDKKQSSISIRRQYRTIVDTLGPNHRCVRSLVDDCSRYVGYALQRYARTYERGPAFNDELALVHSYTSARAEAQRRDRDNQNLIPVFRNEDLRTLAGVVVQEAYQRLCEKTGK